MHLMYYLDAKGGRVYTLKVSLDGTAPNHRSHRSSPHAHMCATIVAFFFCCSQKETPEGKPTESAHPARFSPDDKFSKQRLICKKRFGLLPTQKAQIPL